MASNGLLATTSIPGTILRHAPAPSMQSFHETHSRFRSPKLLGRSRRSFSNTPLRRQNMFLASCWWFLLGNGGVGQIHSQNFRNPPLAATTRSQREKELEFYERFGFYTHTYTLSFCFQSSLETPNFNFLVLVVQTTIVSW